MNKLEQKKLVCKSSNILNLQWEKQMSNERKFCGIRKFNLLIWKTSALYKTDI